MLDLQPAGFSTRGKPAWGHMAAFQAKPFLRQFDSAMTQVSICSIAHAPAVIETGCCIRDRRALVIGQTQDCCGSNRSAARARRLARGLPTGFATSRSFSAPVIGRGLPFVKGAVMSISAQVRSWLPFSNAPTGVYALKSVVFTSGATVSLVHREDSW